MGLAFESISSTNSVPFWQALVNAGDLSAPEMSFWLTRTADESGGSSVNGDTEVPGGVFTLGGTNTSLFSGDIEFNNVQGTPSFWMLNLSGECFVFTDHNHSDLAIYCSYICHACHTYRFSPRSFF